MLSYCETSKYLRESTLSKITLTGHIIIPQADLAIVQNQLENHIQLTRQEQGCLLFNVTQDSKNENKFIVHEEFIDQSAFLNHQLRVKNSTWGKVTKDVERHYQVIGGE